MKLVTIIALSFIQGLKTADGVMDISAGDRCDCDTETADWAIEGGHAKAAEVIQEAPAEVTQEDFGDAVNRLDRDNEDHWTKSGKPDVHALISAGLEITAVQRDALWEPET